MKTPPDEFKELVISAAPDGTYSITLDGVPKIKGVSFVELVEAVRALEDSYNEQIQQQV